MLFCFSLVGRLVVHAFLFIIFNISILETAGGCHFVDVCERCSVLPQMFIWLQVQKISAFKTFKLPSEPIILASSTGYWMDCEMSSEGVKQTWVNILQSLTPYGSFFIMYINSTLALSNHFLNELNQPQRKIHHSHALCDRAFLESLLEFKG